MSDNLNTRLSTQDFIQVNMTIFTLNHSHFDSFLHKSIAYTVRYYVLLNFMSVFHPDYQPQINSHAAVN